MARPSELWADAAAAIGFFTRLPVPQPTRGGRSFAAALWAAPLAGVAVALPAALAFGLAAWLGLSGALAAALALGVAMLVTGCLHEDGLADVADGFGGGSTRERKLAIMRDSRIGSFGVAALLVVFAVRWAALAELSPTPAFWALVGAHAASRALLPFFLQATPPARSDGLAAGLGAMPRSASAAALALGALALLPLGVGTALVLAFLLACLLFIWRQAAMQQIGGQTGDVCGALQQSAEALVLVAATLALP